MADMTIANLNLAIECLTDLDEKKVEKVKETEKYIDYLNEQISDYLIAINHNSLPVADINLVSAYFHVVNGIESIGDHATNIALSVLEAKGIKHA